MQTVSPYVGPVGEQTQVSLTGAFPEPVQVFFGSVEATSLSQTTSRLVALAPASNQAGPVTIRLIRNGKTVLTIDGGFTYQAAGQSTYTPPPTGNDGPGTGTSPTPGTPATGAPVTNPGAGGGGGTTAPTPGDPGTGNPGTGNPGTGNPGTGNPGTGTGTAPADDTRDRSRQSRSGVGAERADLGNGRSGAPITGGNPLASAPACRSNACSAQSS